MNRLAQPPPQEIKAEKVLRSVQPFSKKRTSTFDLLHFNVTTFPICLILDSTRFCHNHIRRFQSETCRKHLAVNVGLLKLALHPAMPHSAHVHVLQRTGHPEAMYWVTNSLRDPYNPLHCANSIVSALAEVSAYYNSAAFDLRKEYRFWATLWGFLTAPRNDEEINTVMHRLSSCNCSMGPETNLYFHLLWWRDYPNTRHQPLGDLTAGRTLISVIFKYITVTLRNVHGNSFSKGTAQAWPSTIDDIMANGPEVLVENILTWYKFSTCPYVLDFIPVVTEVCQTLIIPGLVRFKVARTLVSLARIATCHMVFAVEDSKTKSGLPSSETCFRFLHHASGLMAFLDVLGPIRPAELKFQVMGGCETKAMQLCSIICYVISAIRRSSDGPITDQAKRLEKSAIFYGHYLFRHYRMYVPQCPDIPVHPKIAEYDEDHFPPKDPCEYNVAIGLEFTRSAGRCTAKGCYVYFLEVGRAFRRCKGCNVSSYCSERCSIRDWREGPYPHKELCPKFSVIRRGVMRDFRRRIRNREEYIGVRDAPKSVSKLRHQGDILQEDLEQVEGCITYMWEVRITNGPSWHPGFHDYEEFLQKLTTGGGPVGPKPVYMNRLARWPVEDEAERGLLSEQPFWNQDKIEM